MALASTVITEDFLRERTLPGIVAGEHRGEASAVSWGAIIAGAAAAASLSLILLLLGTGLGLSSVSPWAEAGVSAKTLGLSAILWVTFTQIAASGMGGYLAGRLRTKWAGTHTDEVYFRDTAHGFLAWAVASLATAALLTSAIGSIVKGGAEAGAVAAGGAAAGVTRQGGDIASLNYFVDSLFRRDANAAAPAADPAVSPSLEIVRIFGNSIRMGALPAADMRYAGQVVAQRTGLPQADAEKRVTETYERAQMKLRSMEAGAAEAVDKARKASAYTALWLFISLLIGAFVASLAATFGGRQRDR